MNRNHLIPSLVLFTLLALCGSRAAPLGSAFTYQGRLTEGGAPANGSYDLRLELFDSDVGPNHIGNTLTNAGVGVTNGQFTTALDFGAAPFNGTALWLQIGVRTNGSASDFTPLSPRQPLTPAPYAIYAGSATTAASATTAGAAPWSGLTGVPAGFADGTDNDTTYTAGTGLSLSGAIFSLDSGFTDARYWRLAGNAGTTPGTHFLGTTDSQALELKVNNKRALRLEPTANSVNVIGGFVGNFVSAGVEGATIGGGGTLLFADIGLPYTNRVFADYGTIGGGLGNSVREFAGTIGGGFGNNIQTDAGFAVIAGGLQNSIKLWAGASTIAGGVVNTIQTNAFNSTIVGGERNAILNDSGWSFIGAGYLNTNLANASYSVIGGGMSNLTAGNYATVPGGRGNTADGDYSLAAGRRAKANHDGSLVWADSTDADFASTGVNQLLIRAAGGVGIGKNNPASALDVQGTVTASAFAGAGAGLLSLNGGNITSGTVSEARIDAALARDSEIMPAVLANDGAGSGLDADLLDGLSASAFAVGGHNHDDIYWKLLGNGGTAPGVNFLGTTDNQPVELKVNNARALRLEPNATTPNFLGGSSANSVSPGVVGATIGGGGAALYFGSAYPNTVAADFGTVAGGYGNNVSGPSSTVGGGLGNSNVNNASSATIAGGLQNTIQASYSAIAGGRQNAIRPNSSYASIGGGDNNVILTNADYATVSGGRNNTIQNDAQNSSIGGGWLNTIEADALMSTIGGGYFNTIRSNADHSIISGGRLNTIQNDSSNSTIGGGTNNVIQANVDSGTISGGRQNTIQTNADHSTISGGTNNTIQPNATAATIAGGRQNVIQTNATHGTIAGGKGNTIKANTDYATVSGGADNTIEERSDYSAISGGSANTVQGTNDHSTIAGGQLNVIESDARYSTIGGGYLNKIQPGADRSTIGGGVENQVQDFSYRSTIAGGAENVIQTDSPYATIGGGTANYVNSGARFATIPGGSAARAVNYGQLAYASGGFIGSSGNAQSSLYVLRETTTSAATTELFLDGFLWRMSVPDGGAWTFDVMIVARSSGGTTAGYAYRGVIENVGGVTGLVGGLVSVMTREDAAAAAWDATVEADNANDALVIKVTGAAATTIRWVATVRTVEVIY